MWRVWEEIIRLDFCNVRDRLKTMIGNAADDVTISTYHAFGRNILERYQNYAERPERELNTIFSKNFSDGKVNLFTSSSVTHPWDQRGKWFDNFISDGVGVFDVLLGNFNKHSLPYLY